jgi:drug/metabolite transporter (DMT)-like permease
LTYQATSPAAASITAYLFALSIPTTRDVLRIAIIMLGGFVMSYGDINLTNLGLVLQLGAIVANALRTGMSQSILQSSKMDPLTFLRQSAPIGAFISACCAFVFESQRISGSDLQKIGFFQAVCSASLALSVTIATSYLVC